MKPTIKLISGRYFDYTNPTPLTLFEVASALAKLCRFTGHTYPLYSVAQHSILAAQLVPPEHALQALFHDATEAVMGDMNSPLKHLLPEYKAIEDRCAKVILPGLGVPAKLSPEVKHADLVMLATEKRDLMQSDEFDVWPILNGIAPRPTPIFVINDVNYVYEWFIQTAKALGYKAK